MAQRTMLYIGNDEFISAEIGSANRHGTEQVIVAATAVDIMPGTAMAVNTSGQYVPWAPAASDSTATFAGFLRHRAPASTAAQRRPLLTSDADVNMNKVTFVNTPTAAQLTALLATMSGPNFRIKGRY